MIVGDTMSRHEQRSLAMDAINVCTFSGNVTRKPDLKYTNTTNTPVLNFSIACNEQIRNEDGTLTDDPNFLDFSVFGNRAEGLAHIMKVGSLVMITAKARRGTWNDKKSGEKKTRITFVVDDVIVVNRDKKPRPDKGHGTGGNNHSE